MQRILLPILFLVLVIASAASALDTQTRPVGPVMSWNAEDLERFDTSWLHVKFVEGSNVIIEQGRFFDDSGLDLSAVNTELGRSTTLQIKPTFDTPRAVARTWKDIGELRANCTGPDLSLWFNIQVSGGRAEVARMVNAMNASAAVEIAHPVPIVELARIHSDTDHALAPVTKGDRTDDFTADQEYLYDAPIGLNAPAAWATPGGLGLGMKFIDVELAWTEDHEDFTTDVFYIGGSTIQNPDYEPHGTAVVGEVQGQHNGFGINGFAPDIQFGVVAITVDEWPNVPHYFQEAVDNLDPGDVWLIELQMYPPDRSATPMEWLQVNYDVIWTSSWSLGIVCVEAGANGGQDLDDSSWMARFDRQFNDSGAIMVAAGTPYGSVAESFTNYGWRMDVNAWGSQIVTTGYGDLYNGGSLQTRYTSGFGGTSGASPMVVGAALCLQGIATAELGGPLSPVDLRSLLHTTGTPHQDLDQEIGPRPDLDQAIIELLDDTSAPIAVNGDRLTITGSPNPFSSISEIKFRLPSAGQVTIEVFDAAGRLVRTLVDESMSAGAQHVTWDGKDSAGQSLGSGVYLMRLQSNEQMMSGKVWLVK